MSLKKFESFMEDRERERKENKQREDEIIGALPVESGINAISSDIDTEKTLANGKTIAEEFPIELVSEPETVDFSTEQEINDKFPVDIIDKTLDVVETAPQEEVVDVIGIDGFGTY